MYNVTIYNVNKKIFKTYNHIHTIKYFSVLQEWESVSGEEILTHTFPNFCSYQLIGNGRNYSIDKSLVGSVEIEYMN